MGITLELPEDLASELAAEAARMGLPLAEYAVRVLATRQAVNPAIKTGADLVAYWQREGLVGRRPDITDSQQYAREIRAKAERRTHD
jgi:hypothetical protein